MWEKLKLVKTHMEHDNLLEQILNESCKLLQANSQSILEHCTSTLHIVPIKRTSGLTVTVKACAFNRRKLGQSGAKIHNNYVLLLSKKTEHLYYAGCKVISLPLL